MHSILVDDFGDILWFIDTEVILSLLLGRLLSILVVGVGVVSSFFRLINASVHVKYLFLYISQLSELYFGEYRLYNVRVVNYAHEVYIVKDSVLRSYIATLEKVRPIR